MFVGHYAAGFLFKKRLEEIPLWLIFIAVQFVDILAFILILLGVEKVSYNPSSNPFLRSSFDDIHYTHSLLGSTIIALIVFLIFWKLKDKVWGFVIGGAVFSHWFIDFIVHPPDLPLVSNIFKVGLGLWHIPWLAFIVEIAFFIAAGYFLYKNSKKLKRPIILMTLAILFYAPSMFAPENEVSDVVVSITSLSLYAIFTALAYWSERKL